FPAGAEAIVIAREFLAPCKLYRSAANRLHFKTPMLANRERRLVLCHELRAPSQKPVRCTQPDARGKVIAGGLSSLSKDTGRLPVVPGEEILDRQSKRQRIRHTHSATGVDPDTVGGLQLFEQVSPKDLERN